MSHQHTTILEDFPGRSSRAQVTFTYRMGPEIRGDEEVPNAYPELQDARVDWVQSDDYLRDRESMRDWVELADILASHRIFREIDRRGFLWQELIDKADCCV